MWSILVSEAALWLETWSRYKKNLLVELETVLDPVGIKRVNLKDEILN